MTLLPDPLTDPLNDWLDALVTGQVPPATPGSDADLTDLLATASQLDHLARQNEEIARNTRRHSSWEDQMSASSATLRPTPATIDEPKSKWKSAVSRWQPIVSFSVVLMLLLGLFAITINRASSPGVIPPTSASAPHFTALQAEGQAIVVEPQCTAREVVWHEPESTLAPDRPARYVPTGFASAEIGQQALATYLAFKACEREIFYAGDNLNEDYLKSWVGVTYLTDRAVQEFDDHGMYLTASDAVSLEMTESAPIPVNRPIPTYLFKGSRDSIEGFNAGDVFRFFDGRYGTIIGSVSTSTFREGSDPGTWEDGLLTFVAFVEQDGQLFIDEYQTFCTGEWKSEEGYVWFEGTPSTTDQDAMLVCR